jgi:cobyrinic acid a,c-diamide synthase
VGYLELHTAALDNSPSIQELGAAVVAEQPVVGECGGLMRFTEMLPNIEGDNHRMAGIVPADVRIHGRYQGLITPNSAPGGSTLTARAGQTLRG